MYFRYLSPYYLECVTNWKLSQFIIFLETTKAFSYILFHLLLSNIYISMSEVLDSCHFHFKIKLIECVMFLLMLRNTTIFTLNEIYVISLHIKMKLGHRFLILFYWVYKKNTKCGTNALSCVTDGVLCRYCGR